MELIIKGFIIGIGKILPGISGSMIAVSLGIYEQLIEKISNIKNNLFDNLKYLIKPSIGIIMSIILTSKIIVKCINKYYFATILLLTGLIISGIPNMIKSTRIKKNKKTKAVVIIITIFLITFITIITNLYTVQEHKIEYTIEEFIKLIGIGIIDAGSSIIPGISGTAILMSLGYYNIILQTFATTFKRHKIYENLFVLIPFISGFIIGIIIISKIVNRALKKQKYIINLIISILMISSTITLLKSVIGKSRSNIETITGILLFIIGIIIAMKYENKNTNRKKIYNEMR